MSEKKLNHLPVMNIGKAIAQLSSTSLYVKNVCLQSHPDNKGIIYIGSSDLTNNSYAALILPGGCVSYEAGENMADYRSYYDLIDIYALSDISNQKLIIGYTTSKQYNRQQR